MDEKSPGSSEKKTVMEHVDGFNRSLLVRLRDYFIGGILVTAPIGITVYLTWLFLEFVNTRVTGLIPRRFNPFVYWPHGVPGAQLAASIVSLLLVIVFFVMVGWFARNFLGRLIYRIADYIVERMPVVRAIYSALKQIFETIMTTQSQAFREVVMFEWPRKGIWAMGFVTGVTRGEAQRLTGEEVVNVFLPTTPNPTSGYLMFVPRHELVYMSMSVEEALKMIVSGGILTPPDRGLQKDSNKN